MFFTRPEFRRPYPVFAGSEQYTCWGAVELPAALPWFMIHLSRLEANERYDTSFLIADSQQLENLVDTLDSQDRIIGLQMVRPAIYSGSASWDMVLVRRMWQARVQQYGEDYPVHLYEMSDSASVIYPPVDAKLDEITKDRLVFEQGNQRVI